MQHPFLFTFQAVLFTLACVKCYINVNLIHGEYFVCETYCMYEIYYYLCGVKRDRTERNERKKKTKMTTTVKAYTVSTNYSSATIYARNKKEARNMFRNQYLRGCDYKDSEINVQ